MGNNIYYYIFDLAAIVVAFLFIKRVASCLIRSIVLLVATAILIYVYYTYMR